MLASAVPVGQSVQPRLALDLHDPIALQCYLWTPGAGCDVVVEERRGGAWLGDVLPRWRRESEEIVIPVGLL